MQYTTKMVAVLETALSIARKHKHQFVEPFHLIASLLEEGATTLNFLAKKTGAEIEPLKKKLKEELTKLATNSNQSDLQPTLSSASQQLLNLANEEKKALGDTYITVEHLLLATLSYSHRVKRFLDEAGFEKSKLLPALQLLRNGEKATSVHAENNYQALERYAKNLNKLAKQGKIDPVIGREKEIRRVLQILARRTKNNPILLGAPGVGKTAIAEGIAQKIIEGDVPDPMRKKELVALDMGLLIAGAKYKGEFEERLKSVIQEVIASHGQIILFIDEIHTLVGAGSGGQGAMDAANLLKPGLARGELHTIGATTPEEYQKYFEKDKALVRRFQPVQVGEPSVEATISILRGIKDRYERHHGVRIQDDALIAAAKLTHRYISDRFLPDKAIDAMDEAAAKLRIAKESTPEELDQLQRKIAHIEIERQAMKQEKRTKKVALLTKEIAELGDRRDLLRAKWEQKKAVARSIQASQQKIEELTQAADRAARELDYAKAAEIRYGKLGELEKEVKELIQQQEKEQEREVTEELITAVIAQWTGIPLAKMVQSDKEKLLKLEQVLAKEIAGQPEAISALAQVVRRNRAGLQDGNRPLGSFIFLGTTGVGKSALAKELAITLFNDPKALITIDLSEYQERHAVSRLIGAPPGYLGHEEGGQLTEAIRRKPYAVLLFDEMDKAHPDVFNLLLQLLEEGRLTDGKGREFNFKNAIIIMTTNLGSDLIEQNFKNLTNKEPLSSLIEKSAKEAGDYLKKHVRPEFLNRLDKVVVFRPLDRNVMEKVVAIQLRKLQERLTGLPNLVFSDALKKFLIEKGYSLQYGARPLKRLIQETILNKLAEYILADKIDKKRAIQITLDEKGETLITQ